jgi:hypothetical protein
MNTKQQKLLIKTSWIIGLMMAFPPYYIEGFKGVIIQSGYDFILDLPNRSQIDATSLITQIFVVSIILGLLFFAKKDE